MDKVNILVCDDDKEIVDGVKEGLIDSDTLGFEDYPCELTMKHWREEFAMEFCPHILQAPIWNAYERSV